MFTKRRVVPRTMLLLRVATVFVVGIICPAVRAQDCEPEIIGSITGSARDVAVVGTTVYVANGNGGLLVLDASEPSNPNLLGSSDTPRHASGIAAANGVAYVAAGYAGLQVFNVSDPSNPTVQGWVATPEPARDIAISGAWAYVVATEYLGGGQLDVISIGDPSNPVIVGSVHMTHARAVAASGSMAYVVGEAGMFVVDVSSPQIPQIVGIYSADGARDVYVTDGRAYLTVSSDGDLHVIDVSVPTNPFMLGSVYAPGAGITVSGNTAYVAVSDRLEVVDVTNANSPAVSGFVYLPPAGSPVGVAAGDGLVFVADGAAGVLVIDVTVQSEPAILGAVSTPSDSISIAIEGDVVYVIDGYPHFALKLLDVSDPSHLIPLGSVSVWTDWYDGGNVAVNSGIALVASGDSPLKMIDVSDPSDPHDMGIIDEIPARAVAIDNSIAYVTWSFLSYFIDISDPPSAAVVGVIENPNDLQPFAVALSNGIAYAACTYDAVLLLIDAHDPSEPMILSEIGTPGYPYDVAV